MKNQISNIAKLLTGFQENGLIHAQGGVGQEEFISILSESCVHSCGIALATVFKTDEVTHETFQCVQFNPARLNAVLVALSEYLTSQQAGTMIPLVHMVFLELVDLNGPYLKPKWMLGLEWFCDETEKNITGESIARSNNPDDLVADIPALLKFAEARSRIQDNTSHSRNLAQVLPTGRYWWHLIPARELAAKPKTMFAEPDLEANLSVSGEPGTDGLLSQFSDNEKFFNAQGEERQSMPEAWMLDTGCY